MHEPVVPLSRLACVVAWLVTFSLIAACWVAYLLNDDDIAQVLGYTGCATSAVSATLNIRCFASRMSRLIRAAGGMEPVSRGSLRSVGD